MKTRLISAQGVAFLTIFAVTLLTFVESASANAIRNVNVDRGMMLSQLALKRFPDLNGCEQTAVHNAAIGQDTICAADPVELNPEKYPEHSDQWDKLPTIRAALIRWLLVDPGARTLVDPAGISIRGANIVEQLGLSYTTIPFAIELVKCRIRGVTNLSFANVKSLDLRGSWTGPIIANGLISASYVALANGFRSDGGVTFMDARSQGFDFSNAAFYFKGGPALIMDRVRVDGAVYLVDDVVDGVTSLSGANIDSQLVFAETRFQPDSHVVLEHAKIGTDLVLTKMQGKPSIDLRDTSAGLLVDDEGSWPTQGQLFLEGFSYDRLISTSPHDAQSRIRWLSLQAAVPGTAEAAADGFIPQPYEELAKVLSAAGDVDGAHTVLIAMEKDHLERGQLNFASKIRWWVTGPTIGFGYAPWRAGYSGAIFLSIGFLLATIGYRKGLMIPRDEKAFEFFEEHLTEPRVPPYFPAFSSVLFSLDTVVPIVNFGQRDYWRASNAILRGLLYVLVVLGWALALIFAAGINQMLKTG
jgi:hypothetical protein